MSEVHVVTVGEEVKFIEQLKRNDEQALRSFYTENYKGVEQYVIQNSGTKADAKDVYQEAFVAVWRSIQLDKFKQQSNGSIHNYLIRIAKNKWMDVLRKRKKNNITFLAEFSEETEQVFREEDSGEERLNDMKKAFQNLGAQCKDVLTRFYFKKQSLKEIAASYSWTEATAKNNKYRCLQKLRQFVKNES
ncbi:MAG TPA: sigma-70 family RNA polymerase sigma factor [Flavipsychrobacter sp.]|nr:sigma-70 family RNA polymerase sigma factor [Flavipsychrobacter sp.]